MPAVELSSELNLSYRLLGNSLTPWTAYQFSRKGQDSYSGPNGFYLDGLSENSDRTIHRGVLGVTYSTIPAFRKKKFGFPFEVDVSYSKVLAGKNTTFANNFGLVLRPPCDRKTCQAMVGMRHREHAQKGGGGTDNTYHTTDDLHRIPPDICTAALRQAEQHEGRLSQPQGA